MRKIITLFLVLISIGLSAQPVFHSNLSNPRIQYAEILTLVSPDLGLDTMAFSIELSDSKAFYSSRSGVSYRNGVMGVLVFNDGIREDVVEQFIHELVHVSQIIHCRLIVRGKRDIWFDGRQVNTNLPEEYFPQEIDASQVSYNLMLKYKNELKELRRNIK